MPSPAASRDVCLSIMADVALGIPTHKACSQHGLPRTAFYAALQQDEEIRNSYARAKDDGLEAYAESTDEIADEQPPEIPTQFGSRVDTGWVQWQKNRIENRRWNLTKLAPKKYGDRTILAGDADSPLSIDLADAKAALAGRLGAQPAPNGAAGMVGKPKR